MILHIDPDLQKLLRPLTEDEQQQLKLRLLADGCQDPIKVWKVKGKHIVLDGHNRLDLCRAWMIPYQTEIIKSVKTRADAEDWIDRNQLARRNLASDEYALVLGRHYNRQKNEPHRPVQKRPHGEDVKGRTSERLAKEHGVSKATVERMGQFAQAVEALESIIPDIAQKVMVPGGPPRKVVIEAAKVAKDDPEKAKQIIERSPDKAHQTRQSVTDAVGRTVPEHLREVYARRTVILGLMRDLKRLRDTVVRQRKAPDPVWTMLHDQRFEMDCGNLRRTLKSALPYAVCPYCGGDGNSCKACKGFGLVNHLTYDTAPQELRQ